MLIGKSMSLNKISIYIETNTKSNTESTLYLQRYIILKDNSIKECILKTVHVNGGHCGRFIP